MVEAYFQRKIINGNPIYPSDLESVLLSSHPSRLSCKLGEFISGQQRKRTEERSTPFFLPVLVFFCPLFDMRPLGRSMSVYGEDEMGHHSLCIVDKLTRATWSPP